MSSSNLSPVVSHLDDPRNWTEFGESSDGECDAIWYLHRRQGADGAASGMRCGLFRVAPVQTELKLPYHETILTVAGEGLTTVDGSDVEIRPGRTIYLAAGAEATFRPTVTNIEFITVVDPADDGDSEGGIVILEGEPPSRVSCESAPAISAGLVSFEAEDEFDEKLQGDRSFFILEGSADLRCGGDLALPLRAGSMGFIPGGSEVSWRAGEAGLSVFVTEAP